MNVFDMKFSKVFPLLLAKVERINSDITYGDFFDHAPQMNSGRMKVKGKICGVRIEDIADQKMRDMRILDKLVDEIAKGKSVEKIFKGIDVL